MASSAEAILGPEQSSSPMPALEQDKVDNAGGTPTLELRSLHQVNYLNLPRLPIPDLQRTVVDLLASCYVLDEGDRYQALAQKATDFLKTQGPRLQATLFEQDKRAGYPYSFVQKVWDDLYLHNRAPHPISSSPVFQLAKEKVCGATQAAQFVRAVVHWTHALRQGKLSVKNGLCVSAMGKLFSTAKIPRAQRDKIVHSQDANNIILICRGQLFNLPVIDQERVVPPSVIERAITRVLSHSQLDRNHPVGILTAGDRDEWAQARAELISANYDHKELLRVIDEAIVVFCIDTDEHQGDGSDAAAQADARAFLMGDAGNRWFDKHQIILHEPSGTVALNFEHACSDGTNWIQFIQDCMEDMAGQQSHPQAASLVHAGEHDIGNERIGNEIVPSKLVFNVPDTLKSRIVSQKQSWLSQTDNVDADVLPYLKWGKRFAKRQSLSPDALVQMAFQLAYFRMFRKVAPTYESAHMRRFFCGRTDTIRSCSAAAKAFVIDWQGGVGQLDKLKAAVQAHAAQSKKVASGAGIDRHLLCLETLAAAQGENVPLFEDALYKASATWVMSTSNASDPNLVVFGFGPVIEEGFGLGYLIQDEGITVMVTCFKSAGQSASRFTSALTQAFDDIAMALNDAPQNNKPTARIFP